MMARKRKMKAFIGVSCLGFGVPGFGAEKEKKSLALLINAFVAHPERNMGQVMDDMALYAKKQGLDTGNINTLLDDQ